MLSGIGPAQHLKDMGIEVKADRPGVGANLQDHMEFYFQQVSTKPVSLYSWLPWFWQGWRARNGCSRRGGLGASNQFEACAFLRSAPGVKQPDIQYHFLPVAISYDGKAAAKSHGFQVHVGYNLSKSRGSVTLRSADPDGRSGDPLQLYEPSGGLGEVPPLRAPDPRDLRPEGLRPVSRAGNPAGRKRADGRARSTPSCANIWKAPITPAAPAGWAPGTTRWPSSIRKPG